MFLTIGIILIILLLLVSGGLLGWLSRGIEFVFSILFSGWGHLLGCLFKMFVFAFSYMY